jgi:hypothetical protein
LLESLERLMNTTASRARLTVPFKHVIRLLVQHTCKSIRSFRLKERLDTVILYTANEGLVKILYKGLVPIYVFQEIKLLFPKQNFNVLSPSSYTHISVRDLYISRIGLPILLQGNMWTNPGNI